MFKFLKSLLVLCLAVTISACGTSNSNSNLENNSNTESHKKVQVKESPDKYTAYIKDYVGDNCATIGYESMGGDRNDYIGEGYLKLVLCTEDGHYIGVSDETLKDYMVVDQNLEPNTEVKFTFEKDSDGNEFSSLIEWQSINEVVLKVKKVGSKDKTTSMGMTQINSSQDKYTAYVKDYRGRNLANCGYISMGGDLRDYYSVTNIVLNIKTNDGSYVDLNEENILEQYVVIDQGLEPNTEISMTFEKDGNGNEYSWTDYMNYKELDLYVEKLNKE